MINVVLFLKNGVVSGFEIKGHSTENSDDISGRIICSAVSSAAIMTANTITEILGDNSTVESDDGYLLLKTHETDRCSAVLDGFRLHITSLRDQYPDKIKLTMKAE